MYKIILTLACLNRSAICTKGHHEWQQCVLGHSWVLSILCNCNNSIILGNQQIILTDILTAVLPHEAVECSVTLHFSEHVTLPPALQKDFCGSVGIQMNSANDRTTFALYQSFPPVVALWWSFLARIDYADNFWTFMKTRQSGSPIGASALSSREIQLDKLDWKNIDVFGSLTFMQPLLNSFDESWDRKRWRVAGRYQPRVTRRQHSLPTLSMTSAATLLVLFLPGINWSLKIWLQVRYISACTFPSLYWQAHLNHWWGGDKLYTKYKTEHPAWQVSILWLTFPIDCWSIVIRKAINKDTNVQFTIQKFLTSHCGHLEVFKWPTYKVVNRPAWTNTFRFESETEYGQESVFVLFLEIQLLIDSNPIRQYLLLYTKIST